MCPFYSTQVLCLEICLPKKKKNPCKSAFALTSITLQKPSSCFSVTYISIYNGLSKPHGYLASCNICLCSEPIYFFFLNWVLELRTSDFHACVASPFLCCHFPGPQGQLFIRLESWCLKGRMLAATAMNLVGMRPPSFLNLII